MPEMKPRWEVQVQWALVPDRWVMVHIGLDLTEALIQYEYFRDYKPTALRVQLLKLEAKVVAEASK